MRPPIWLSKYAIDGADTYIFTGDRITGAFYAHESKEIDSRSCFFESRLTFEESDKRVLAPSKNTRSQFIAVNVRFPKKTGTNISHARVFI